MQKVRFCQRMYAGRAGCGSMTSYNSVTRVMKDYASFRQTLAARATLPSSQPSAPRDGMALHAHSLVYLLGASYSSCRDPTKISTYNVVGTEVAADSTSPRKSDRADFAHPRSAWLFSQLRFLVSNVLVQAKRKT